MTPINLRARLKSVDAIPQLRHGDETDGFRTYQVNRVQASHMAMALRSGAFEAWMPCVDPRQADGCSSHKPSLGLPIRMIGAWSRIDIHSKGDRYHGHDLCRLYCSRSRTGRHQARLRRCRRFAQWPDRCFSTPGHYRMDSYAP